MTVGRKLCATSLRRLCVSCSSVKKGSSERVDVTQKLRYPDIQEIKDTQGLTAIHIEMPTKAKSPKVLTHDQVSEWKEELFLGRSLRVPVENLRTWPLKHYLWAAVLQAKELHDEREAGDQNWQTPAWDFGRFAKAHPLLLNMDENEALDTVKKTIGTRFWEDHFEMDPADAEMAFDNIWVQCRAVPGYDPVTIAILDAKKATRESTANGPAGYATFLEVARSLQRQLNGEPFMLPCHKLAPMLSCEPMTISRYRQKAIRDGHLRIVKEHSYRSAAKGEATEFVFVE